MERRMVNILEGSPCVGGDEVHSALTNRNFLRDRLLSLSRLGETARERGLGRRCNSDILFPRTRIWNPIGTLVIQPIS